MDRIKTNSWLQSLILFTAFLVYYLHLIQKKISYLPKISLTIEAPILRSTPDLVVGIPVCLAIFCFARVIPIKRLTENVKPLITCYILINLNSALDPLINWVTRFSIAVKINQLQLKIVISPIAYPIIQPSSICLI